VRLNVSVLFPHGASIYRHRGAQFCEQSFIAQIAGATLATGRIANADPVLFSRITRSLDPHTPCKSQFRVFRFVARAVL
jgi:hypothetical protein